MLNLIHLKYFHDAFLLGSLAEAARRNYVSRPAVSQALRSLQESLGEKLVYNRGNKTELTAKGQWLFDRSVDLLKQARMIEQQIRCENPEISRSVVLCSSRSLAEFFFGSHAKESILAKSVFPIDIKLGDAFKVRRELEMNSIDFGIAVDDGNFQSFEPQVLYKGSFKLFETRRYSRKDHLLIGDKGMEVESFMNSSVSEDFRQVTSIQSWDLIASLASQGHGQLPVTPVGNVVHSMPLAFLKFCSKS